MRYGVFTSVVWLTSPVYTPLDWHENKTLEIVRFLETSSDSHLRFSDLNQHPPWNSPCNCWCSFQTTSFSRIYPLFSFSYFPNFNHLGEESTTDIFPGIIQFLRFSPFREIILKKNKNLQLPFKRWFSSIVNWSRFAFRHVVEHWSKKNEFGTSGSQWSKTRTVLLTEKCASWVINQDVRAELKKMFLPDPTLENLQYERNLVYGSNSSESPLQKALLQ